MLLLLVCLTGIGERLAATAVFALFRTATFTFTCFELGAWFDSCELLEIALRIAFGTRFEIALRSAVGTRFWNLALGIGLTTGFTFEAVFTVLKTGFALGPGFRLESFSTSDSGSFEPKSSGFRSSKGLTGVEVVS